MSGMRAGCVENFLGGANPAGQVQTALRLMSNAVRRMSTPVAECSSPLPFRRASEVLGWAGADVTRGRTRSIPPLLGPSGRGESSFPPSLLGPGGRGEAGFSPSLLGPGGRGRGESAFPPSLLGPGGRGEAAPAYPPSLLGPGGRGETAYPPSLLGPGARGAQVPAAAAAASWNSAWQGDGWGWSEARAGMGGVFPEASAGVQQPQQQPLLPRPSGRGLIHLGDQFPASQQELQHLYSLIQREAEKRGSPWVAGLSRAVEEISAAAEEETSWPTVSPQQGEQQERPAAAAAADPLAVAVPAPVPALVSTEAGVPLQVRCVWIAGHTAIACASRRACNSSYGQHLGLIANGVQVLWMDKGVRSDELLPALLRQAEVQPCPDALVIHLGSNDFEQISGIRLIKCIKKDLVFLNTTYPNTKIIWSDILPNRRRRHEKCLDRSRKKVNKQISDFVRSLGGMQVRHEFFSAECASLYKQDGVQLSDIGNDLFNMMMQGAIKSAFGIV
ncbi:uncharacterized protein LOC115470933 [Microcaecilia unicolor]|uniref:Uncharacterized protein LOC115470933 n=1 Tax=Microcaecilia unicolor TaxID=1415580 RepID=A0A6P7XYE3_9AMPH|nr:uncharacterized protein LOC115470933 [Microcaecilia unicolor]